MKVNKIKLELAMANACIGFGELAKKSKISSFTIARMQTGANTHPATIGKIARALNVDVCELIEDTAATVNQSVRSSESNK